MRLPDAEAAVADELAALSTAEIVEAAGARGAPRFVKRAVEVVARLSSRRLGKLLARFDARVGDAGVARAAREVLQQLGAVVDVSGEPPPAGGALLVCNHPGAFDALATLAALARDDVAVIASERPFLRALPHFKEHVLFVADSRTNGSAMGRAAGLRSALAWLAGGGVLVQFGAGAIEPDARFAREGEDLLGPWPPGTGVLAARASALGVAVVPAFVSGVHSRRAMRLPLVRFAERRGITTIAPLIQATMPGFRDVVVSVRFGAPLSPSPSGPRRAPSAAAPAASYADVTARLREAVRSLASGPRR